MERSVPESKTPQKVDLVKALARAAAAHAALAKAARVSVDIRRHLTCGLLKGCEGQAVRVLWELEELSKILRRRVKEMEEDAFGR